MSFPGASFDEWKTRIPGCANSETVTAKETCERCGKPVAAVSVARCGDHFSYYPSRPERRGGK